MHEEKTNVSVKEWKGYGKSDERFRHRVDTGQGERRRLSNSEFIRFMVLMESSKRLASGERRKGPEACVNWALSLHYVLAIRRFNSISILVDSSPSQGLKKKNKKDSSKSGLKYNNNVSNREFASVKLTRFTFCR